MTSKFWQPSGCANGFFQVSRHFKASVAALLLWGGCGAASADLILTGVVDGPLTGGIPKAIEVFVASDIPDLSIYGLGSANNGDGTDGEEFTFPAVGATAGQFLYVASEATAFGDFFGFVPDYTSSAASINGDDAIELFKNGVVVDLFGDINTDGSGEPWDYLDGWAYRVDNTGPDGSTFVLANWSFSGINALDGETSNGTAATPFPLASYTGGGGGGDTAPFVLSTTPADGAGQIEPLDALLIINFSEAVDVAGTWFNINCSLSGTVFATVSGGPQSFNLDLDVDLANSESCTVIVLAAQVSDQDGSPDNMAANYEFSFTTAGVAVADTVIVNEIMQNPNAVSDSNGEWFELFNTTGSAIELMDWTVKDDGSNSFMISGSLIIAGGGFVVLGNNADFATNGGVVVDYEYSGTALGNGSDEIVLLDAASSEIDRVEWDNGATFPDPTGASMALIDPALDNNVGANWCTAASSYGDGDAGTPGQVNDCGFRPVINEIDYDQPSSDTAEFVELFNRGTEAGDLSSLTLKLVDQDGSVYQSVPLPAVSFAPGDYFVVCADAFTVAACDLQAISFIQNGGADAVALTLGGSIVDTVSYEGDAPAPYTEGSGAGLADSGSSGQDFKGISRLPNGADSNVNNMDLAFACITPGAANTSIDSGCSANGPVLEIHAIQGSGLSSPFAGQNLGTNNNVVTAVAFNGFFMQTPDARIDADIDTSEGIWVFTGFAPGVAVGDLVDVRGPVAEYFGLTEFDFGSVVTVLSPGNPLPTPVTLDGTVPSPVPTAPSCAFEFECYEGMRVEVAAGVVTGSNQRFGVDPIAEVYITTGPVRTYREPGIEFPGLPGLPVWDGNPEVFEMDTDKVGLPTLIIPAGSTFSATGVIGFDFGGYELFPTSLTVNEAPLPQPVRAREAAEMTVGSLNLFRLFDDVDDPSDGSRDDFVVSSAEYQRRLSKLSQHILQVLDGPDILAVQEAEKLGVLEDLAAEILATDPTVVYTAHLIEGNDIGTIDVGFLVRDTVVVDAVTQLGADEILTFDGSLLNDRPPLLLEGRNVAGGSDYAVSVMSIHSRSLGGIEGSSGPRVRQKRLEQAQSVAQKVQDIQTANPDVRLIVIGDFNAFEFTDGYVDVTGQMKGSFEPLDNLLSGPDLVDPNLIDQVLVLPAEERYSFIFQGNAQTLDHALTSSALDSQVSDVAFGRGNADAAVDLLNDDSTPLRSSDHDGLVVFLIKDSDNDSVPDDVDYCPDTSIPELGVPSKYLKQRRYALVDDDFQFDTIPFWKRGGFEFSIEDTGGCSCEQIIEEAGLGPAHGHFGCGLGAIRNWVNFVNE